MEKFKNLFYEKQLSNEEIADFFNATVSGVVSFRVRNNLPPRGWANGKHPQKGKHHSLEVRKKISKNRKGKCAGILNSNWKGGETKTTYGYILKKVHNHPFINKNGYIGRNRYVMEQHLGRYLAEDEVVHHINGIRDDDRIENLCLLTNSSHGKLHTPKGSKVGIHSKHK